jgi:uncharacterized membrane protein
MSGRTDRGRPRARIEAVIGHALAFATWRSLAVDQDLDDNDAAELMCRLVAAAADDCAAGSGPRSSRGGRHAPETTPN